MTILSDTARTQDMIQCATSREAFSPAECDRVINLGKAAGLTAGVVLDGDVETGVRDSQIARFSRTAETAGLFDKILNLIHMLNQRAWQFELAELEALQFATYNNDGHYTWHTDIGQKFPINLRKVGLTVQLSDPDDYEGGDFETFYGPVADTAPRQRGTVVLFPSFVLHRVAPVTRGTRHSLTAWMLGSTPFR
jgi:PKHD-type hydroxylase